MVYRCIDCKDEFDITKVYDYEDGEIYAVSMRCKKHGEVLIYSDIFDKKCYYGNLDLYIKCHINTKYENSLFNKSDFISIFVISIITVFIIITLAMKLIKLFGTCSLCG